MNEERLTNLKKGFARVEGRTDRFFSRTTVLLDEIAALTQALDRSGSEESPSTGTSGYGTAAVSQLANSIVRYP